MAALRTLVVEDSLTVRRHLVEALEADAAFEVVGEAADGQAAIALCERLRPDVITMDLVLPELTGLAATEHIMAWRPTPILIVSASTNRGELLQTYDALAAGAVDVLEKPRAGEADDAWATRFRAAVRMVAHVRVITHPRARLGALGRRSPGTAPVPPARPSERRLVAIGTSTGGPGAILTLLRGLPPEFPLPICLVIHIGEPFGSAMAEWLHAASPIPVRYATDGERWAAGAPGVLMAPPGRHLEVAGERLRLGRGPERHSCRPSVDVLFESAATAVGPGVVACLLTGMGRDGAEGLRLARQRGGLTVAQDEASSVVWGMPGEAVRLGAATHVLPLDRIAPALCAAAGLGAPA